MDCPVCREPMVVLELNNVEIDYCLECKGTWLDSEELELLLEGAKGKDQLLGSLTLNQECAEAPKPCPICSKKMNKVLYGNDLEKVLLDKCKVEHGLWFDAEELEKVLVLGSNGEETKVISLLRDMFGKKNI